MNRCLLFVACIALMLLSTRSANSEIVRLKMTGTVNVVDPTFVLPADVVTGAPFTALLTYDTGVRDSLPDDPRRGWYELSRSGTEFGLSLTVGSLVLADEPNSTFVIEVLDNASLGPGVSPLIDSFIVHSVRSVGGPPVLLPTVQVFWDNPQMNSWNSDVLPLVLDPSQFRRTEILASGGDEQPPLGRPYDIAAFVDEVTVVPEPTTVAFLIGAMIALLALTWRRRRATARTLT